MTVEELQYQMGKLMYETAGDTLVPCDKIHGKNMCCARFVQPPFDIVISQRKEDEMCSACLTNYYVQRAFNALNNYRKTHRP